MYYKKDLILIKKDIEKHIGTEITLRSSKGRQRTTTHNVIITKTYPSIFTVKTIDNGNNVSRDLSFSYTDVLTKAVKITLNS